MFFEPQIWGATIWVGRLIGSWMGSRMMTFCGLNHQVPIVKHDDYEETESGSSEEDEGERISYF